MVRTRSLEWLTGLLALAIASCSEGEPADPPLPPVEVEFTFGSRPAGDLVRMPVEAWRMLAFGPGDQRVEVERLSAERVRFRPTAEGMWCVFAVNEPDYRFMWERERDELYRVSWDKQAEDEKLYEYQRHYLRVGETEEAGITFIHEATLLIHPEIDPTSLALGDELPITCFLGRSYYTRGEVQWGVDLDAGEPVGSATPDEQGAVTIPIDRPGPWMVRATYRLNSGLPYYRWLTIESTLTFEVRDPGEDA